MRRQRGRRRRQWVMRVLENLAVQIVRGSRRRARWRGRRGRQLGRNGRWLRGRIWPWRRYRWIWRSRWMRRRGGRHWRCRWTWRSRRRRGRRWRHRRLIRRRRWRSVAPLFDGKYKQHECRGNGQRRRNHRMEQQAPKRLVPLPRRQKRCLRVGRLKLVNLLIVVCRAPSRHTRADPLVAEAPPRALPRRWVVDRCPVNSRRLCSKADAQHELVCSCFSSCFDHRRYD